MATNTKDRNATYYVYMSLYFDSRTKNYRNMFCHIELLYF